MAPKRTQFASGLSSSSARMMAGLLAGLAAIPSTSARNAHSPTGDAAALERSWAVQNAICLDGEFENEGPVTPRMKAGCDRRNAIMKTLRAMDRCYGRPVVRDGLTMHALEWHDCTPGSLNYDHDRPRLQELGAGWRLRR